MAMPSELLRKLRNTQAERKRGGLPIQSSCHYNSMEVAVEEGRRKKRRL
jgi:hypothetical protein